METQFLNRGRAARLALLGLLLTLCHGVWAAQWTVAVVGMDNDPRYASRQLDRAYAGHPGGRAMDAVRVALEESAPELEAAGHRLQARAFMASGAADLPRVMAQVLAAKAQYLLLDLPQAELLQVIDAAPTTMGSAILFNIGESADVLRGAACALTLLHTFPSAAMLNDALAQFLAAKSWTQALVLSGPLAQDAQQLDAFKRSAKRYGVKLVKTAPFKLSGDPRERDLSNTRLLTNDKSHDVVAVLDSDGEFARTVPFNTQWPRPVVGSSGLTPLAWHPQWDRNGGPQLSRRFSRMANRPMGAQDWAAWMAVKAVVAVLSEQPKATLAQQLGLLRSGQVYLDGFKGPRLSFRPWDGQLRQPVFLAHADGVAALAPLDGVLHPTDVLDTLGVDEKESTCKKRL